LSIRHSILSFGQALRRRVFESRQMNSEWVVADPEIPHQAKIARGVTQTVIYRSVILPKLSFWA
jgi:hypothetical protein